MFTLFEEPNICFDQLQYCIYQQEETPTTHARHWQGYCELKKGVRMRLETLKNRVLRSNTVHVEERRGTQEEAIGYCSKCEESCMKEEWRVHGLRVPGTMTVITGTPSTSNQGHRADLEGFMEEAEEGSTMPELRRSQTHVCAKYHKFCEAYVADVQRSIIPAWREITVNVYWGHTGMGKTRRVYYEHPDVYKVDPAAILWWDGYVGQDVVLIDDFDGWIPIGNMLNILDGYPLRLPVKGGFCYAAWQTVFITANTSPEEWYHERPLRQGHLNALLRRLTNVVHITDEWRPAASPAVPVGNGL